MTRAKVWVLGKLCCTLMIYGIELFLRQAARAPQDAQLVAPDPDADQSLSYVTAHPSGKHALGSKTASSCSLMRLE